MRRRQRRHRPSGTSRPPAGCCGSARRSGARANASMALRLRAVSSPPAGSTAAAGADVNRPATRPTAPAITRPALKALSCFAAVEQRVIPQLQRLERLARQRAALQDVVLRLVVVGLGLILVDDFLEDDDVLALRLDQQPRPGLVDRRRREGVDGDGSQRPAGTPSPPSSGACRAPSRSRSGASSAAGVRHRNRQRRLPAGPAARPGRAGRGRPAPPACSFGWPTRSRDSTGRS